MMPPPASRVIFNFYKCLTCTGADRHQVKVVFAPFPDDKEADVPLFFTEGQDKDGLMTTETLEKFLKGTIDFVVKDSGSSSDDIEEICKIDYE